MSEENTPAPEQESTPGADNTPPASGGFDLGTVIAQAKQVVTSPRDFYRGMAKSGGYSEPLIFLLVMGVIAGLVFGVLSLIGLTPAGAAGLGAVIMMPIGLLIGGFIGAAIMFVIWKLMGSPENYETAYRCVAYSTAVLPVVAIVAIIPYVGTAVRTVWGVWLMIIASEEVHARAKQTAMLVFGILGAIGLFMGVSGEYAQRNIQQQMEKQAEQLEERFKNLENLGINEDGEIDPEQVGRAVGEFMKGMEEAAKRAEEAAREAREAE
ncbi:MAG: YIP1 family protein [Halioglobus sp.]|nr:YIP1 family protein [Halioglobus sp.]